MVSWVPVQAVGSAGEGDSVQYCVDRSHNLHITFIYNGVGAGAGVLLTSSPSSLAGQLMIARLPEMKSF